MISLGCLASRLPPQAVPEELSGHFCSHSATAGSLEETRPSFESSSRPVQPMPRSSPSIVLTSSGKSAGLLLQAARRLRGLRRFPTKRSSPSRAIGIVHPSDFRRPVRSFLIAATTFSESSARKEVEMLPVRPSRSLCTGTDAPFAILSRVVAKWCATQNKTANSYVIEITI